MLRLNSLSASGMRYGRLRTKRLACSRMSQPLDTAVCAVSCALDTMSAIILVSFLVREVVARFLRAFFIVHEVSQVLFRLSRWENLEYAKKI